VPLLVGDVPEKRTGRDTLPISALSRTDESIVWPQGARPDAAAVPSLFVFHTESNVGYAIEPIERLLYEVGLEIAGGDPSHVHFAFRKLDRKPPRSLPRGFRNVLVYDHSDSNPRNIERLAKYVRDHKIRLVVIWDIQATHPLFRPLHQAGAQAVVSIWGAPISSPMPFWKLALKQLEMRFSRSKLDGLIFESRAMADLAVCGRGVSPEMIDVVHTGVDVSDYKPGRRAYVYEALQFPRDKKVIVYSGHMEARKGVRTLVEAAIDLLHRRKRRDVCFLICGNKGDESEPYQRLYDGLDTAELIRFGGYRSDMPQIYAGCFAGVIPSSGWDSFPRSAIEMSASGLPVVASRLGGLPEAVLDGQTGILVEPSNASMLADSLELLLDQPDLAAEYGRRGKQRCDRELDRATNAKCLRDVFLKRLSLKQPGHASADHQRGGRP
jgi:glycosyltransferase involved in cell wall biosynthesis